MEGNTSDRTTLRGFLEKIETLYGKARRTQRVPRMMDRGIPTEEVLAQMRDPPPERFYLVGRPRGKIQQYQKQWLELSWREVREAVEVKLFARDGELYVLAKSQGRRAKESAIRRRKLVRRLRKLRAMRRSSPPRDQLLMRIGAAQREAGRAFGLVKITLPKAGQEVTPQNFTLRLDQVKLKPAELRDGHDLLRTNLTGEDAALLWDHSIQLTQIEAVFKRNAGCLVPHHRRRLAGDAPPHRTRAGSSAAARSVETDPAAATPATHQTSGVYAAGSAAFVV